MRVTASTTAVSASSGSEIGNGMLAIVSVAPSRSAAKRSEFTAALYSWSVVSSSSPGAKRSERRTVAIPLVAFGNEGQVVGIRSDEGADGHPRRLEVSLELARQEPHGLGLHPVPPRSLDVEHVAGACPERAVVEEVDLGVQAPPAGELARAAGHASSDGRPWSASTVGAGRSAGTSRAGPWTCLTSGRSTVTVGRAATRWRGNPSRAATNGVM